MSENTTIYAKILAVRQEIGALKKTGLHGQGWNYFKSDEVLEQIGDALTSQGILFIPEQETADLTTTDKTETALIRFAARFVDVETGEEMVVHTHGSARDTGDKAIFKAQTLAIKYLFLRMFLVGESDDEPEAASAPPDRASRQTASRSASKPAKSNGGTSWIDFPTLTAMLDKAEEYFAESGVPSKSSSHHVNRIAVALGISTPHGIKKNLLQIIQAEYTGTKADAWKAIQIHAANKAEQLADEAKAG